MTRLSKIKGVFFAACLCLGTAICGGRALQAENGMASADETVSAAARAALTMQSGATIKDGVDAEGTSGEMGLRWAINMPKTEYAALKSDESYESVQFGIFIAPSNYHHYKPLNDQANVYGATAVYDWADENGEYTGTNGKDGGKFRIINLESNIMVESADNADMMRYYGSLIEIADENLTKEFAAVGYIRTKAAGESDYEYTFAPENNNVISATYQAQLLIDAGKDTEGKLQSAFVDPVASQTAEYTVSHYKLVNDNYVLDETVTERGNIGSAVTAEVRSYAGYRLNTTKSEQSKSGKVYANDKLSLALYYDPIDVGQITHADALIQTDGNSFDLTDLLGEDADLFNEYAALGSVEWTMTSKRLQAYETDSWYAEWVTNELSETYEAANGIVDFTEIPYTVYEVKATLTIGEVKHDVFIGQVDFCQSGAAPVWNYVSEETLNYAWGWDRESTVGTADAKISVVELTEAGHSGKYYKMTTADNVTEGLSMHYNIKALHTEEYYEMFENYVLSFDYQVPGSQYYQVGFGATVRNDTGGNAWYSAKIPVKTLLANWKVIAGSWARNEAESMLFASTLYSDSRYLYAGNFCMKLDLDTISHADVLIDVKDQIDGTVYDLKNLLTAEELQKYTSASALGSVEWTLTSKQLRAYETVGWHTEWVTNEFSEKYTARDTKIDFSELPYAVYEVKTTVTVDGVGYELFIGQVDFYHSGEAPVWNYVSEETLNYAWGWNGLSTTGQGNAKIFVVDLNEEGHSGKYFKMSTTGDELAMHYNIKALHTEEYYEIYRDYVLTFEYQVPAGMYYQSGFGSTVKNDIGEVCWYTAEISVATLLEKWTLVAGQWANGEPDSMLFVSTLYGDARCLYAGNFRMVAPGA